MNGELAQLVALVSYGNGVLAGRLADSDIDNDRTVGPTCEVAFVYPSGPRSVTEWVHHLRLQGVERLELDAVGQLGKEAGNESLSRHQRSAFSTTLGPTIVSHTKRNSEVWGAEWNVIPEEDRTGELVWLIRYRQVYTGPRLSLTHPSVVEASRQLSRSLVRIQQFAEVNGHADWGTFFAAASTVLAGKAEADDYHQSLLASPSPDAHRLLRAASKGWAFGGMGSWNDLDFSGDENAEANYNRVTAEHYQASLTALDAATNAANVTSK
jgi:hypothetical protein